ncbi:iron-containing alcohol dehydrogenase [Alphaproteobacteria bacterium]|nr:iron-containing alcohol dehydrogenase [Alphaproteobacteria bacterium]
MNEIVLPKFLNFGGGAVNKVADILKQINCNKPIIITDKTMVKLKIIEPLEKALTAVQIMYSIYDNTIPEPTSSSIEEGVSIIKEGNYDCIIAFGGGSPIDSAKAMSVLAKFGGNIADYKFPNVTSQIGIPLIAIPTTAGTGSEVTKFTIITNEKNDEKMLCVGPAFMPLASIIDFKLTLSVPKRTTADTAIDSLTHAIEAFVSKKSNLFSDTQAISAMQLIAPNIRSAYNNGNDEKAREKLMVGATLAGLAFSNSSVALVHGMSRPIGSIHHVPHGLSNAMLLPTVTSFSIPYAKSRYAQCAKAMGIANNSDDTNLANKKLISELYQLNKDLEVPSLQEFGINKEFYMKNIEVMSFQAIASGSPGNNPVVPSHEQLISLYKEIWN